MGDDRQRLTDIGLIALSSYKLARVVAKDQVAAFVRAPVTEDPEAQTPKRGGMARALGELVTCPYCIGLWISSALTPRETRFFTAIFGSYAVQDFLHAGFVRLRKD